MSKLNQAKHMKPGRSKTLNLGKSLSLVLVLCLAVMIVLLALLLAASGNVMSGVGGGASQLSADAKQSQGGESSEAQATRASAASAASAASSSARAASASSGSRASSAVSSSAVSSTSLATTAGIIAGESEQSSENRVKASHGKVLGYCNITYMWFNAPDASTELYNSAGSREFLWLPDATKASRGVKYTIDGNYYKGYVLYTHDAQGKTSGSYTFSGWSVNGAITSADITNGVDVSSQLVTSDDEILIYGAWEHKVIDADKSDGEDESKDDSGGDDSGDADDSDDDKGDVDGDDDGDKDDSDDEGDDSDKDKGDDSGDADKGDKGDSEDGDKKDDDSKGDDADKDPDKGDGDDKGDADKGDSDDKGGSDDKGDGDDKGDDKGDGADKEEEAIKHSVIYTWANFPILSHTYRYIDANGNDVVLALPESKSVAEGKTYDIDATYTKDYLFYAADMNGWYLRSYTFSGWSLVGTQTMGTTDVKITGTWTDSGLLVRNVSYEWEGAPSEDAQLYRDMEDEDSKVELKLPESQIKIAGTELRLDSTYESGLELYEKDDTGAFVRKWTFFGWSEPDTFIVENQDMVIRGEWASEDM